MSKRRITSIRGERGSVLAISALGMLSVLLISGLCIDVSQLYMAKIELQDAADAAALAAASQLNSTSGGIKLAVAEATKTLNKYGISQNVTIPNSAITFSVNLNGTYMSQSSAETSPTNIRFAKVVLPPKPVNMSLSAMAVGQTLSISASAIAGMSVALTMNKFYSAFLFIEPVGDASANHFQLGESYTLGPKQWQSHDPHTYRVLAGEGGDLILTGTIHAYGYANSDYMVEELDKDEDCRIARIGVNTRFADYSWHGSTNSKDEPPDTIISQNISYETYSQMQGNGVVERTDGVKNRRVMTIPIAETDDYDVNKGSVIANRIGAFFLKKKMDTTCDLDVEYIGNHLTVPVGEYRTGGIQLNQLSIPVLYR